MKFINNNSGFALIEVMVAAGLLGVIAYLFMSMGEQVSKMDARIKNSLELNELAGRLQISMGDGSACERTFAPLFADLKTNEKLEFPIKINQLVSRFGNTVLKTGSHYGRFKVDSIEANLDKRSFPEGNFESQLGFIKIQYKLSPFSDKSYSRTGSILLSGVVNNPFTSSGPYLFECASEKSLLIQEITNEVIARTCASFGVPYNNLSGICAMENISSHIQQPSTANNVIKKQKEELQNMQKLKEKAMKMMKQFMQEN